MLDALAWLLEDVDRHVDRVPQRADVAAHLLRRFVGNGWVKRIGTGRALRLTPSGTTALRDLLAIEATTHDLA